MLLRKIGEGAQGAVYLAQGPDGRQVAVKALHDRLGGGMVQRDDFIREAIAARQVPPFSTARVLDVGVASGAAYIVSEYVRGRSLERVVHDGGPVGPDTLTRLAIQTSAALSGIHSANIVHRDFKPSNILIADDGPRVIDFGVAKALEQVTMTGGGPKGTPAYMSPEQISGRPVGPKSDVFSWASTMFYGATGRLAFDGSNHFHTANLIMNHSPDISAVPRALQGPISLCLNKDPRNRPTAAELMVALAR
jgi:serine/threonine protein kinase